MVLYLHGGAADAHGGHDVWADPGAHVPGRRGPGGATACCHGKMGGGQWGARGAVRHPPLSPGTKGTWILRRAPAPGFATPTHHSFLPPPPSLSLHKTKPPTPDPEADGQARAAGVGRGHRAAAAQPAPAAGHAAAVQQLCRRGAAAVPGPAGGSHHRSGGVGDGGAAVWRDHPPGPVRQLRPGDWRRGRALCLGATGAHRPCVLAHLQSPGLPPGKAPHRAVQVGGAVVVGTTRGRAPFAGGGPAGGACPRGTGASPRNGAPEPPPRFSISRPPTLPATPTPTRPPGARSSRRWWTSTRRARCLAGS